MKQQFEIGNSQAQTNLANQTHKDSKLNNLIATVVVEGNPLFVPDSIIEITGVAGIHSGKWYVEKVKHDLGSSGYLTTLELRKNATDKPLSYDSSPQSTFETKQKAQNFPTQQATTPTQTPSKPVVTKKETKDMKYNANSDPIKG